jgi:GT2 family glycosyltransferase
MNDIQVSIIIVSFNTKALLDRCFAAIAASAGGLRHEIIVVDNQSRDGSVEHIRANHPGVILVESGANLGFGGANNLGFKQARGTYVVLLNSDAFLVGDALRRAHDLMERRPEIGLAGGRLIGEDGAWQPSARTFPGLWNEFVTLTGLAHRKPHSRLFGTPDMTWRDQNQEIICDWVPGAFMIIRKPILDSIGLFDPAFFLYYEEVDLCRRIRAAGHKIAYWPELTIIHIGGASTASFSQKLVSKSGRQMGLWRWQSQFLYYRKQHGFLKAWASGQLEAGFLRLRLLRNRKRDEGKAEECRVMLELIRKAWTNTRRGTVSPPIPWPGA